MILINQNKNKIVNLDNLTQIYITQDEEETAYYIRFETVDSLYDDLGEYATEERAKEVLNEIGAAYTTMEVVNAKNFYPSKTINGNMLIPYIAYEMPEK